MKTNIPKLGLPNLAELALPNIGMALEPEFEMAELNTQRDDLGYVQPQNTDTTTHRGS